jgi:integrase
MRWCVKRGYRTYPPILDVGKIVRRKRRVLKPEEIQAIWAHANGNFRMFFGLTLGTGMRRREAMDLEWSQVNFVSGAIFLPADKTKNARDRYVTLPAPLMEMLFHRKNSQPAGTRWVFPHSKKKGQRADLGGLMTAWRTCLRRAYGLKKGDPKPDVTWHDLRATCESYAHKPRKIKNEDGSETIVIFSDSQLEKYFGSSADVQRKIYIQGDVDFVRGVENPELFPVFNTTLGKPTGDKK